MDGYFCHVRGEHHTELPLSYRIPAPADWLALSPAQRQSRAVLSSDQCIIDNKSFFLAGNIDIPIVGEAEAFTWTLWISVTEKDFNRVSELWEKEVRETEPPFWGRLRTSLPCYPPTLNLKTHIHTRPVGERPFVQLERTDHPLAVEQRQGMSRRRVQEIAELLLHGNPVSS